jgi:hypothetical protein
MNWCAKERYELSANESSPSSTAGGEGVTRSVTGGVDPKCTLQPGPLASTVAVETPINIDKSV